MNIASIQFLWPWSFLLAIPLAVAAWRMLRRGRRTGVKFAPMHRLPSKTAGWRARLASAAPFVFLAGAAFLVIACARPRIDRSYRERITTNAVAIAMTVDVSGSMDALDLTPKGAKWKTRLEVVKEKFAEFVKARPDDLIGLVTFGGYAASRVPVTADHAALLKTLEGVQIPVVGFDAAGKPVDAEETLTAVGDGLATALDRLKTSKVKSRIVVLLSDGESNTGAVSPDEAAKAAAAMGVKVYAIGVGSKAKQVPIRVKDHFGRYQVAYAGMEFNEDQLKSIAATTGGRYFSVGDSEGLDLALAEIDSLEKTEVESVKYELYDERFIGFLLIGALLVLIAVSLQMAASRRLV